MMTRTLALGTLTLLLLAACGSADNAEPAVTPTTTAATTTTATTTAPTSPPPLPPTTAPSSETTVPEPSPTQADDEAVLGAPAPHLLEARPSDEVPWDSIGPGWLAFTYPKLFSRDDATRDERGLYLVDPDDRIYAVSALPEAFERHGIDLVSASWTGHVALLKGSYSVGVLDLETTRYRTIVHDRLETVSLTRDGTGLWVYDIPRSQVQRQPGEHVRVSLVKIADGSWTTIYEEFVAFDELWDYYHWWVNNRGGIVEMTNGDIAFGTPVGVKIGPADGSAFRTLDAPGDACSVVDAWDAHTIQVRCALPDPAFECDNYDVTVGLWLVPTDGSATRTLAIPDVESCTTFASATPLGGDLAISAVVGSGECNSGVLLDLGQGLDAWVPPFRDVDCNERLLGTRHNAWLVTASNPYVDRDYPIRTFEVTPTASRAVPIPDVWVVPLQP
jgi:hypothetical protein